MIDIYLAIPDNNDEKRSLEEIYYKYSSTMYSVAYKILNNKEDAEDAVQNAFIAIARNFQKIQKLSGQKLIQCLVIIVRNHSINIYNRNKRQSERAMNLDNSIVYVNTDFFENYDYEELVGVIFQLPEIYRDVIFLRYVSGFTVKEISRMLDLREDTVWKRTERARNKLKEALEER